MLVPFASVGIDINLTSKNEALKVGSSYAFLVPSEGNDTVITQLTDFTTEKELNKCTLIFTA